MLVSQSDMSPWMGDPTIESVTAHGPSLSLAQCRQGRKKILLVFLNIVNFGAVSVPSTLMVVVVTLGK
jgi:hypothetical protein